MSIALRPQSITGISGFTALTSSVAADYLAIDPGRCSGIGGAPLRTTVEDVAGDDGVFVEDTFDSGQIITLGGDLIVTSNGHSSEDGYFAAMDALVAALKNALELAKTADRTLAYAGTAAAVRLYAPLEITWQNYWAASVTFGLIVVTNDLSSFDGGGGGGGGGAVTPDTSPPTTPTGLTATAGS